MNQKAMRHAIAMIELIFAIVIMGIVMMSAPMLISTASKSGYVAIQQESINEAASQVNIILGYQWDESNTNESYDPIVLSASGDTGLDENGSTGLRTGTPKESYRKFFSSTGERGSASAIGAENLDDMDDFDGTQIHLTEVQAGGNADYIQKGTDITIDRTVKYMSDAENGTGTYADGGGGILTFSPTFTNGTPTTNIKRIQVTLTSSSSANELNSTNINLHAFSCNIGSPALEKRP